MLTIGLVGCGKGKLERAARARDLYTGALFRKASAYCSANYAVWFILSAKHGILEPNEVIDPYDLSLKDMPLAARQTWAHRVLKQIDERGLSEGKFYIHAGERYSEHPEPSLNSERLLRGLSIGKQLAWYNSRGF